MLHSNGSALQRIQALEWIQIHYNTILKTLNPKKATGCDQITVKLLKHASFQIAPVISNILNKALDEGTFLNTLMKAGDPCIQNI